MRFFILCTMKPLVSIIMAAKNTEPFISSCLDSSQAQTYTNWELIAVNDHSTDRTADILKEYAKKDSRIKIINSKREKLIPALKEGVPHCTGELLNRMDSDDRMPKYKLEVLVNEWMKYGKGHVIAGGTKHFVESGEVGGGFLRYDAWLNEVAKNGRHYEEIYRECVIPSHCWIIHKDDFDRVKGFQPEVYPEDYDLCFRFYKNNLKIIGIDRVLHYWRDHSIRISRTWDEYKDNRYFEMKLRYFFELDRDHRRPLVLWGAGRNGKDFALQLSDYEGDVIWITDNPKKVGKDIYGIRLHSSDHISQLINPQIIVVVASPSDQVQIRNKLDCMGKKPITDYWFFN
jgi:glycosyltransferase involved in cell wall biosynthesis